MEEREADDRLVALLEAVAARDAFIAIAAHELRNPMTPIVAQVQLMRRQFASGKVTLEKIDAGLERLEWMTEQYIKRATTLLDVSRITTGKLTLEPRSFELGSLVRQIAGSYGPVAILARCSIEVDADDGTRLVADPLAVEQIIDNLISNALKYGAGHPVVVSARAEDTYAIVRVVDHGAGISDADQRRIFERFERAIGAGHNAGGFGVGLWIVTQLARAMRGTVEIESLPGEGSTFTLRLPLNGDA